MDGCQECLRESRGDRVMSHDERTCPEASTWHVQFPFKLVGSVCTPSLWEVVLIFVYGPSSLATSWSSVFHFANNLGNRITVELFQVHWGGGGGGYRLLLEWVFLRLALN